MACSSLPRRKYKNNFKFLKLFSEASSLDFNAQVLSQHAGYLRNALSVVDFNKFKPDDEESSNYQVIGQYDVSKYEEKPFEIELEDESLCFTSQFDKLQVFNIKSAKVRLHFCIFYNNFIFFCSISSNLV